MAKQCVFCGKDSRQNTKEHVIPQWLMRLSRGARGDVRIWSPLRAGLHGTPDVLHFDQTNLQFPACRACNQYYSHLESDAKMVVKRILKNQPLEAEEILILLDWLDKVRVGVWLGMRLLEKDPFKMPVNFHITERIGKKDRAVLVYEMSESIEGWSCLGTSTPAFHKSPTCFSLVVNSVCFLNVSTDFLLSRGMGLPYPESADIAAGGQVKFNIVAGSQRLGLPIVGFEFAPGCGQIFQPNISAHLAMQLPSQEQAYVNRFRPNRADDVMPIFLVCEDKSIEAVSTPTGQWRPTRAYSVREGMSVFLKQTLRIQNDLLELYTSDDSTIRGDIADSRRFNDACIDEINKRAN